MATPQVLERIRHDIIESDIDSRYLLQGYEFVLNGLDFYLTQIGEKRHVTGQELSKSLLNFAHKQYGPVAKKVLNHWGIFKTDDFGHIVYNLIGIGIMSKRPEDSVEHFYGVVDFDDYFRSKDSFEIDRDFIKRIKGA